MQPPPTAPSYASIGAGDIAAGVGSVAGVVQGQVWILEESLKYAASVSW